MSSVTVNCPECGEDVDVEFTARGYRGRILEVEFEDTRCPECGAGLDECWLEAKAAEALV